jgi:urease accessory protein
MIIVEAVLGNIEEPGWKARLDGAQLDFLDLDQWKAQKSRLRCKSEGGLELAVSLERNTHLHDGDILSWDEGARKAVVARIALQDVMVIRLDGLLSKGQEALAQICLELGHALGNQHWPAVVKGTHVYVPLTVDRKVMASVMKTHAFEEISYEFSPGAAVIPFLAPHESRRLFGGADSTPHSHLGAHAFEESHSHPHDGEHSQHHDHEH